MKANKPKHQLLAWVLVITLIMSTGINAWATESESGAEVQEETKSIEQSKNQESESDSEWEEVESESGYAVVRETQTEEVTEKLTEKTAEAAKETEKEAKKQSRAGGTDRSADFKADYLQIKYGDNIVYEETNGNSSPITSPPSYESTFMQIKIVFKWSQKAPYKDDFVDGDYLEFEISSFISNNSVTTWAGFLDEQALKDKNDNSTILGYGKFRVIKESGEVKLVYRVTFNEHIENKTEIGGEFTSNAQLINTSVGDHVTVKKEGESILEWERKDTVIDNGFVGPVTPIKMPETGKSVNYYNNSSSTITWQLSWNEFTTNRYLDKDDNYQTNNYDYIIVEDLLDCFQVFYKENNQYPFGLVVTFSGNMPLYDPDELLCSRDKVVFYSQAYKYLSLATDTFINLDGSMSAEAAVAEVKSTPQSMTVVQEPCPDHPEKTRQRMVINLGAPNNGGYKFTDFKPYYTTVMTQLDKDISDIKTRIIDVAEAQGTTDDEIINDWAGLHPKKLSEWKKILKVYKQTYEYYHGNPYIYSYGIQLKSKFNPVETETANLDAVRNNVIFTSGNTKVEKGKYVENTWSGSIYAKAKPGEVQIFKADAQGGYIQGPLNASVILGEAAISGVKFQVFESGSLTALKFKYNTTSGKYELNPIAGAEEIETDASGSLVLAGLTHGKNYTIRETAAAEGYYVENAEVDFTVDNAKAVYQLLNNSARVVELSKVDEDTKGALSNAVFELYRSDGTHMTGFTAKTIGGINVLVYTGAADTGELKTDSSGKLKITQLPAGNYYFNEITAPSGYIKPADADNKIPFNLPAAQAGEAVVKISAENTRDVQGEVGFGGTKYLTGRDFASGDSFSFVSYQDKNDGNGYQLLETKTINPGSGTSAR